MQFAFLLLCLATTVYSEDYYELLGITKDADTREIRKAFKKMALKLHPDKNLDDKNGNEKFIEINKAYEVLKDEETRKKYDLHGEEGLKEDFGRSWKGNYRSWNYYYESFGIYDDDPEIITLSKTDFEQSVLGSSDIWFINFYSPQCSHCHHLAPAWRRLALELQGVIRVGAVNCEEDWMLCRQQNVHSYPSLIIYPQSEHYRGSREADAMIEYMLQLLPDNVIELTSRNFHLVSRTKYKNHPWLVFHSTDVTDYTDGDLKKLGIILERMVNVAKIDAKNDVPVCELISCDHKVTLHFNLSKGIQPDGESKSIPFEEESGTRDIADRVLQLLPEARVLTEEILHEMIRNMEMATSPPFLVQFTKSATVDSQQHADLKRLTALLPGMTVGSFDCQRYASSCSSFHIQKYPTFIMFKPGGSYEFHYGRVNAHDVARFTQEALASQVQTLTPENLPQFIASGDPWFIDFFAPWCPPCMQLLPEFRKASHSSGHLVKFGTVDCTVHSSLCSKHNVRSYPTTILYNNSMPHTFQGSHSQGAIEEFVEDILRPSVVSLTPGSFESFVKGKNKDNIWVIDFFAPWCRPCQQLAPHWRKLAKMLTGQPSIHIGQVDCQEHSSLCSSVGVNSYPTIRLYPKGSEGIGKYHAYNGWDRDATSLQAWIYNFLPSLTKSLSSSEDYLQSVLSDGDPWLVDFFTPWCSHCQTFAPEFEKIAQVVKGKVKAGKVDCQKLPHICSQAYVQAYPTVMFYSGSENGQTQNPAAEEVHTLTFNGIISFLEDKLDTKIQRLAPRDEL